MKNELYEQVLQHLRDGGNVLAEYGEKGDVPHHIWSTIKYLPESSGELLLRQDFNSGLQGIAFNDQLIQSHAYNFYPFRVKDNTNKVLYIGREGFLRYNIASGLFTVSLYPDGYDEVNRNSFEWGGLLMDGVPEVETAVIIGTMLIWYNYCEVCDKFTYAMDGILNHTKKTYEMLRDYMYDVIGFYMLTYDSFARYCLAVMECGKRRHICAGSAKLYNILNNDGNPVVRFVYDDKHISIEWKDGSSHLSTHAYLVLPLLSSEVEAWLSEYGVSTTDVMLKCLCGLLSMCHVRLNWHEADSRIYTCYIERLNVPDVDIHSLRDVVC